MVILPRDKKRIISLYRNDPYIKTIASIIGVNFLSVQTIVKSYKNNRIVENKKRGNKVNNKKITPFMLDFILDKISSNCVLTLNMIREKIISQIEITLSLKTIRRSLLDISLTLKRLNCTIAAVNASRSKELRFEYANLFLNDINLKYK
ncbi:hypothetical protein CDIK_3589 [Cucumispora dikerogammari]|nr:hypothetical protein CDIK_3589 [Cucumispora dikerogammari]